MLIQGNEESVEIVDPESVDVSGAQVVILLPLVVHLLSELRDLFFKERLEMNGEKIVVFCRGNISLFNDILWLFFFCLFCILSTSLTLFVNVLDHGHFLGLRVNEVELCHRGVLVLLQRLSDDLSLHLKDDYL